MPARPQVIFTAGVSGSGKTLARCAIYLVEEFLPLENGVHWSNFPVKFEAMAAYMKWDEAKLRSRVKTIPAEVMKSWADGQSGPWEFFEGVDIKGAHIAIDEAHRYAGTHHADGHIAKWMDFCGGLRHRGATIEFLTQNHTKLATAIKNEAGMRIQIHPADFQRDKYTGCYIYDLLQLLSKITNKKWGVCFESHSLPAGLKNGAWKVVKEVDRWWRNKYFALYDSYNELDKEGDGAGDGTEVRKSAEEWQRYSLPMLLLWVFYRNPVAIAWRAGVVVLGIWLLPPFYGGSYVLETFMAASMGGGKLLKKPGVVAVEKDELQPTVAKEYRDGTRPMPGAKGAPGVSAAEMSLLQANQQLKVQVEELSRFARDVTSIVGIMNNGVFFDDGSYIPAGEAITFGPFKGRRIIRLDPRRALVELDDRTVLRLGVVAAADAAKLRKFRAEQAAAAAVTIDKGGDIEPTPAAGLPGGARSSAPGAATAK